MPETKRATLVYDHFNDTYHKYDSRESAEDYAVHAARQGNKCTVYEAYTTWTEERVRAMDKVIEGQSS